MNNRRITVLIGACLVMTAVSGCSSGQKKPETELESLVVEDIEVIDETEYVSDEAEGQETEAMTLDFSDESGESGSITGQPERKAGVEESTEAENGPETEALTELETEGETAAVSVRKSGESQAKSESELPKHGSKSKRSETATEGEAQGQSGTSGQDETQKQSGTSTQDETQKQSGTSGQDETQGQSGTSGQRETQETDENRQSDRLQTPTEKSQDESESDIQGEGITEPETDTQGEKVREPETDAQGEGDREAEAESEGETEYGADTENETETAFEPVIMLANDRVNVRREPSTDAEALALLTPQSRVLATGLEGEWTAVYYQQEDDSFTTGYIKSEFLDEAGDEVEDALLEEEAQRLMSEAQEAAAESETQTAEESDAERSTDAAAAEESDAEQSTDAAAVEESDAEQSTDTAASEENETESEAGPGVPEENDLDSETDAAAMVTNDRVNVRKEPSTDSEALTMLEPGSQISATGSYGEWTAVRCQKEDGSFLDGYIKSEFLDDPADEAASQEDEGPAETSPVTLTLSEGPEAQFELAKAMVPEIQKAGVIYSKENKDAEKQLEQYEKLGEAYGIELVSVEIEEEADIDLAASELAGEVDCVFCLEDAVVEQTVQTICAYADEVEIPVFGLTDDQVEQGCAAAYEDGILHWNSDRAQKLGISLPELGSGKVEQH